MQLQTMSNIERLLGRLQAYSLNVIQPTAYHALGSLPNENC